MKCFLILLFSTALTSVFAQTNWIKDNAVWHYSFSNISTGWIKVWDDGDTVVQNITCTKLKSIKHEFFITGPGGEMMETELGYIDGIVYYQNDIVFYWDVDHFSVLYDFNASTGDSWILQHSNSPSFGCNDTSICHVTNVDTVVLGGNSFKQLYLTPSSDANVQVNGKVNARFGSIGAYLLPFGRSCDGTIVEFDQISLTCFQDDSLYYNASGSACEIYLGIDDHSTSNIRVYPNPSKGNIEVIADHGIKQITLVDVLGNQLIEIQVGLSMMNMDLSMYQSGNYYLKIETSDGDQSIRLIQILDK